MAQSPSARAKSGDNGYRDAWFEERIEPALQATLEGPDKGAPLYEPNQRIPAPRPIPERRVQTHRAPIGDGAVVVASGDLTPPRSQWADVRDWNDPLWPAEMFRVSYDPHASAKN